MALLTIFLVYIMKVKLLSNSIPKYLALIDHGIFLPQMYNGLNLRKDLRLNIFEMVFEVLMLKLHWVNYSMESVCFWC